MPEQTETLNQETSSTSQTEQKQDANMQEVSSTTHTDDKVEKQLTPLERAMSIVDASSASLEKKQEVVDEAKVEKTEAKTTTTVEKKTTPLPEEVIDKTKQGDERFDKIPRFKELIDWKKTHEPLVQKAQQQQQWMQSYNITEPMLQETYGFLTSLMAGDFNKAYTAIKPIFDNLEKAVGVVKTPEQLPQDLQTAVSEGKIALDYATQLHQARVGQTNTQQMTVRQQQQQSQQQGATAINTWEASVRTTDADWTAKRDMVDTELKVLRMQYPQASPQELVTLCQKAYDTVNTRLKTFVPAPAPRTLPSANGSTKPKETKALHGFELAMDIVNKKFA